MKRMLFDRRKTSFFSSISNDLSYGHDKLAPFINTQFSLDSFSSQIDEKSKNYDDSFRAVLSKELMRQYGDLVMNDLVKSNIASLKQTNSFTVVTGHQLNLFGGPLYIVYKIAQIIKLARQVEGRNPSKKNNSHILDGFGRS